jgi:hypothetical protein
VKELSGRERGNVNGCYGAVYIDVCGATTDKLCTFATSFFYSKKRRACPMPLPNPFIDNYGLHIVVFQRPFTRVPYPAGYRLIESVHVSRGRSRELSLSVGNSRSMSGNRIDSSATDASTPLTLRT